VYLQQILAADPANHEAFDETVRLLTGLERWHELIELLERRADTEAQAGNRAAELGHRVQVAAIWGEKLGAEDSALEALQAVLASDPEHFSSLMAVARIYENQERWQEASESLQRAAEAATLPQDRADVLCRRATVQAATGAKPEDLVGSTRLPWPTIRRGFPPSRHSKGLRARLATTSSWWPSSRRGSDLKRTSQAEGDAVRSRVAVSRSAGQAGRGHRAA
jgi:tetratricopeptide (TPR) repeat protein